MGAGRSCSVAIGLAEEDKPASSDFATVKVTNSSASRAVRHAVTGGLTKGQLQFLWNEFHDNSPMTRAELKNVLKKIIANYPNLYNEAISIAFTNYTNAPNPTRSLEHVRKSVGDDLAPVLKEVQKHHGALNTTEQAKLVEQYLDFLKIASTITQESFIRSFQHDIGPVLVQSWVGDKYPATFFSSLGKKTEQALLTGA